MKIQVARRTHQLGNALVITLVLISILSMTVSYYLSLVEQQNLMSFRSQAWNAAIVVTEAGIEEGLEHLNTDPGSSLGVAPWSANMDGSFTRQYTFANGDSYTSVIAPIYDPSNPFLAFSVTAQAWVDPKGSSLIAQIGGNQTLRTTVSRAVRVKVSRGNLLIKGMVAKKSINMKGNDISTDSFDSTDPSWSTVGQYDPTKTRSNGDVATNEALTNSVGAGNANIYGHVITGPGGTVSVNSQGGVGDKAWVLSHLGQIQPGYVADNANFTFPETMFPYTTAGVEPDHNLNLVTTNWAKLTNTIVTNVFPSPLPFGGVRTNRSTMSSTPPNYPDPVPAGLWTNCSTVIQKKKLLADVPPSCSYWAGNDASDNWWFYYAVASYNWTVTNYVYDLYSTNYTTLTNHYDNILYSGDYYIDGTLSGRTLVLGNARLVVTGGINMTGSDVLQISQMGSLLMYSGGSSVKIGGNGVINENGYAINCQIYCTETVTSLTMDGNGEFIGVLVAPEASVQLNGGGHSVNDYMGALMARDITLNGHYNFHYDEALSKNPAKGRYIVTTWDEITPSN